MSTRLLFTANSLIEFGVSLAILQAVAPCTENLSVMSEKNIFDLINIDSFIFVVISDT